MLTLDLLTGKEILLDKRELEVELDSRYVNITGDTMTGGLVITPAADTLTALVVNDKDSNNVLTVDTVNNRVGIGTTSPSYKLEIVDSVNAGIKLLSGTHRFTIDNYASDRAYFAMQNTDFDLGVDTSKSMYFHNGTVNTLTLKSGNVGIGTTSPTTRFHLAGTTSSHYAQIDTGINLLQVSRPTVVMTAQVLEEAGNVNAGTHYYTYTFVTLLGETSVNSNISGPHTFDATHAKAALTIPVSTDYRVTKRRIYRSLTNTQYNLYLLYEIPDNTTTTYTDNKSDAELGSVYAWYKPNTTNAQIQVSGQPILFGDDYMTNVGFNAGLSIKNGGGYYCTLIGANAGRSITTGSQNTFVGSSSGFHTNTGSGNVNIGEYCGYRNNGNFNVFIGNYTASAISTGAMIGNYNTVVGSFAFYSATGNINSNTVIGRNAGYNCSGNSNVFIGYEAGYNETGSNRLYIANSNTATPLIYGLFSGTGAGLTIHSQAIDGVPLTVKGIAAQTANLQEWQNSSGTSQIAISPTGAVITPNDLIITCGTDKTLVLTETVYNDLYTGIAAAKIPAANYPDWTAFTANTSAYTFKVNDYADLTTIEVLHDYKEGTDLEVHLHLATNGLNNATARKVKYTVYYTWAQPNTGSNVFSAESSLTAELDIPANQADKSSFYLSLGTITGTNMKIGAQIKFRIKRVACTGTEPISDPFLGMVGVHYQIDSIGSRSLSTK